MEYAFTSPVRTVCGMFVMCCMQCLYVRVSYFVVRRCAVSRRYIHVCNCDMFSVVNVYFDHLKFCVVCIDGGRYVCCSECNVVSNECNEPTSCLVQSMGTHGVEYIRLYSDPTFLTFFGLILLFLLFLQKSYFILLFCFG